MRRGIDMHTLTRGFQDRAQKSERRALAIGAGDMDRRRQLALRMIESRQQSLHALKREIDALGMQRGKPRDDSVNRLAHDSAVSLALTRAPEPAIASGRPAPAPWSTTRIIQPARGVICADAPPCPPCRAR